MPLERIYDQMVESLCQHGFVSPPGVYYYLGRLNGEPVTCTLLAKQIASLDIFASGRLVLGVGVGNKEDDFQAAATPFKQRGKIMDQQLEQMKHIWSGEPVADGLGSIGPLPLQSGGPRLLFGGDSPVVAQRISRWGEGFLSNQPAAAALQTYKKIEETWKTAGRAEKPRFTAAIYFALGPDASEKGPAYVQDYYGFRGPVAETIANSFPKTPDKLKERIRLYEDIGADALILMPTTSKIDQMERLIDVLA
jgi:alkanesulfonate monooxygenase SsuD/methylene tetrahydromethanopterin reductase-like flavin-dependent oxidoreductase (luciferase family)